MRLTCAHCGKRFNSASRIYYVLSEKEYTEYYCSSTCAMAENGLAPVSRVHCAYCGKAVGASAIADEVSNDLFCSPSCALSAQRVSANREAYHREGATRRELTVG